MGLPSKVTEITRRAQHLSAILSEGRRLPAHGFINQNEVFGLCLRKVKK